MNKARHNTDLRFARRNNTRAVRTDQTRSGVSHHFIHINHITNRNAFGDTNDQRNACGFGFEYCICGKRGRHENARSIGAGGFDDQAEGIVDLAGLVCWQGVFAPLEDLQFFRQLRVDPELGTIVWPNGADIDPLGLWSAATGQPITFGPQVTA